jgi:hypothetical protein
MAEADFVEVVGKSTAQPAPASFSAARAIVLINQKVAVLEATGHQVRLMAKLADYAPLIRPTRSVLARRWVLQR